MKPILPIILVCFTTTLCAAGSDWIPNLSMGYIDDQKFESTISKKLVIKTPDWTPQDPLPVSTGEVVKIAMKQFDAVIPNRAGWDLESISLQSLKGTGNKKWYFVVTIVREEQAHRSSLSAYVSFGGEPGIIRARQ